MGNIHIADFKSRLGEHLRQVQRGHVLTVMDRNTPIAQVLPYEGQGGMLEVRFPHPDHPKLSRISLPPPLRLPKMLLSSSSRNDRSTGDCLY
jgi:prevent-host-death family protein